MQPQDIVTIILNVTLIGTFIAVFFFTYGKTLEENIVKNQGSFIAKNIANDIKPFLDNNTIQDIQSIPIPNMEKQDKIAKDINQNLQTGATTIVIIAALIGFSSALIISNTYKLNFIQLLKHNLIILFFVGLTYFLFLYFFGQHLLSADPNYVKYTILTTLKNKLPQNTTLSLTDIQSFVVSTFTPQQQKQTTNVLESLTSNTKAFSIPLIPTQLTL